MPTTTDIPAWKSVTPNRHDPLSLERSIKTLDRQAQLQNQTLITEINNVYDGTTSVPFTWQAYTGA